MKKALIRNGNHMRPMHAVLVRYNIGALDKFHRGLWISEKDIPEIEAKMQQDKTGFLFHGRLLVNGTCRHNQVEISDFQNALS